MPNLNRICDKIDELELTCAMLSKALKNIKNDLQDNQITDNKAHYTDNKAHYTDNKAHYTDNKAHYTDNKAQYIDNVISNFYSETDPQIDLKYADEIFDRISKANSINEMELKKNHSRYTPKENTKTVSDILKNVEVKKDTHIQKENRKTISDILKNVKVKEDTHIQKENRKTISNILNDLDFYEYKKTTNTQEMPSLEEMNFFNTFTQEEKDKIMRNIYINIKEEMYNEGFNLQNQTEIDELHKRSDEKFVKWLESNVKKMIL